MNSVEIAKEELSEEELEQLEENISLDEEEIEVLLRGNKWHII